MIHDTPDSLSPSGPWAQVELTPQEYADKVAKLEALHKIGVAITSTLEIDALLQLVVEQAALLLNTDSCSIALLEQETGELVFMAAVDDIVGKRIPPGQGIMFRSLQEGKAQIVPDLLQESLHYAKIGKESKLIARSLLSVPLQVGDKPLGVLAAVNRQPHYFSLEDRDLLVTMAGYVSIAIENTRLFKQVQHYSRELEQKVARRTAKLQKFYQRQAALAKIELAINQPHELDKVLKQICESTTREVTINGETIILLWDEQTQSFTASATTYQEYSLEKISNVVKKQGISRSVVETRRPVIVQDLSRTPFPPPNPFLIETNIQSLAAFPLLAEEEVLGVMVVVDRQRREFLDEDIDFMTTLANRAANSIWKVRLYEAERKQRAKAEAHAQELRKRERYLAILNDITRTAIEQQDLHLVLETIAPRLQDLFQASGCYITLWDEELERTLPSIAAGKTHIPYHQIKTQPGEHTMTASVLKAGRALLAKDVRNTPYIDPEIAKNFPMRSLLGLPLIADNQKLGAVLLAYHQPPAFSDEMIMLGEQAARQIALAIAKIQAIETAQRRAREAETLRQAAAAVSETLNEQAAIERILLQMQRVVPYDSASVQLLREGYLEIVGGNGWDNEEDILGLQFPVPGDNPNSIVIRERRPLILENAPESHRPFLEVPHSHIRSWLGVPLIFHEKVIGMLALDSKQPHYFTSRHASLVAAFADQVAIAIENARLFETTKKAALEARIAQDILHRLNVVQDVIDAFPFVTEGLLEMTEAAYISLAMLDEDPDWFIMIALDHPRPELSEGTRMRVSHTSAAEDVLAGRVHLTPDLSLESTTLAEQILLEAGHKSRINLPLRTPSGVIGALNLTWKVKHGFQLDQIPILMQISDAFALAIQKQRLLETERVRVKELEALRATIADISAELEMPRLLQIILKRAIELLNVTGGEVGLVQENGTEITVPASFNTGRDDPNAKIFAGDSVLEFVAQTGEPILIPDFRRWENCPAEFAHGPWYGVIATPINIRNNLLGVLALCDTRPESTFKASDLDLLTLFASQVAIAIDNAKLFEEVQLMATTDELTGINNRRQLFQAGREKFEHARRSGLPFSAIMFDIDHFKKINDNLGHATGDEILHALAETCFHEIRKADIFGRYGGEEFTILLPNTTLEQAKNLAERLRARVENTPFRTNRGEISITISLGVAQISDDIPDLASLIDRADTALYAAKQSGRNQVVVFETSKDQ